MEKRVFVEILKADKKLIDQLKEENMQLKKELWRLTMDMLETEIEKYLAIN